VHLIGDHWFETLRSTRVVSEGYARLRCLAWRSSSEQHHRQRSRM